MHWADKIAKEIIDSGKYKPYWVDDMKTPSGYAHIGSMLGPVIHSSIFRALKGADQKAKLTYVFNDFDPADEFPAILKETLDGHQGKALKMVPSPDPNFDNLADFLADDLKKSIEYLGFEAEYLSSWDLYKAGKFDEVIKLALDNSEKIQDIYQKVSGSQKKEAGWLPFQVICEKCGKVGTTRVFDWDGEKVSYKCEPNMVTWAKGCGHEGKISPFGGTGKLPWKVDWAAHWKVLDITVEGAGKDHASAGGSYDIALTILEEVFKKQKPYHFGYEFLLIGGRKMSSSKGVGLKAHDLVKILPAEVARFLFVNSDIKSQSNFDPMGTMAIPDLFDSYDKCWEAYNKGNEKNLSRTFELSQIKNIPKKAEKIFLPRFKDIANFLSQGLSGEEVLEKLEKLKGGNLTDVEKKVFDERVKYSKVWLENYAPEEYRFEMTDEIPEEVKNLSDKQKEYLGRIHEIYEDGFGNDPAELQNHIYSLSQEMGLSGKEAFSALYLSILGKPNGPRAGVLLTKIGKDKVLQRLTSLLNNDDEDQQNIQKVENSTDVGKDGYLITEEVKETFPGISFAYVIISGLKITKQDNELDKLKGKILALKGEITVEKINEILSIKSYREVLRRTGIDYHSRRPSPDALLRRISQGKNLYTINTAVDAYNLAVIETGIGLGGFDFNKITEPVILRFSKKGERMLLLGDEDETFTEENELVYADKEKLLTIDLNYRDINETKITEKTKNIILFADGGPGIDTKNVMDALILGANYITQFCGGTIGEIKLIE